MVLKRVQQQSTNSTCSATLADQVVLKQGHGGVPDQNRSVTMADQAVLKPVGVDMPFELGIPISKNCKICQVFLFLRPARPFFDQALGSPQASIPALTAVWIHCSKLAFECEYTKRGCKISPFSCITISDRESHVLVASYFLCMDLRSFPKRHKSQPTMVALYASSHNAQPHRMQDAFARSAHDADHVS